MGEEVETKKIPRERRRGDESTFTCIRSFSHAEENIRGREKESVDTVSSDLVCEDGLEIGEKFVSIFFICDGGIYRVLNNQSDLTRIETSWVSDGAEYVGMSFSSEERETVAEDGSSLELHSSFGYA